MPSICIHFVTVPTYRLDQELQSFQDDLVCHQHQLHQDILVHPECQQVLRKNPVISTILSPLFICLLYPWLRGFHHSRVRPCLLLILVCNLSSDLQCLLFHPYLLSIQVNRGDQTLPFLRLDRVYQVNLEILED